MALGIFDQHASNTLANSSTPRRNSRPSTAANPSTKPLGRVRPYAYLPSGTTSTSRSAAALATRSAEIPLCNHPTVRNPASTSEISSNPAQSLASRIQ